MLYEEWELPPQPPLEQRWAGEIPFRTEPNQSVTVAYTITYNWTWAGITSSLDGTHLEIHDRRAPANTFEVREYDIGSYDATAMTENASYAVRVYSPSGELVNEAQCEGYHGISWLIEEPGTYRIVVTNPSPFETLEILGTFQFTRNRFYRPYARLGYVTLSLALGFPIVVLVGKLRERGHVKDEAS